MQWLATRNPQPTDAVRVTLDDTHTEYMLNVASTGLGGEVDRRVNAQSGRGPFTFTRATVGAILQYQPQPVQVTVDGAPWYDDSAYTVVVANGPTFGQGMKIAPGASVDDGVLDVLVVKGVSRWSLLMALWRVYNGSHLSHPAVMHTQAARVEITSDSVLPLDMDGEYSQARRLVFAVQPGCLSVLR